MSRASEIKLITGPEDMTPNPVDKPGGRNLFCPHYIFCLDVAVANWWQRFTCEDCIHKDLDARPDIEEFAYETVGWDDIWSEG
jgi:hypothetical protein